MHDNTLGGSNSGRARYDPTRKQGNANTLALGNEVTTASVISSAQLERWSHIAAQSPRAQAEALREAQAERSARSKARCEAWPNTIEALRVQAEQSRVALRNADEARRIAIDEEEAQLRETKRQQVVQAANIRLLESDERGIQLRKALQLHNALQGQEQQRKRNEERRAHDASEREQYAAEVRANALAEQAEKLAQQKKIRDDLAATKEAQLQFLEFQLAERRQQREMEALDRERIRLAAEEEALGNATKKLENRVKNVQLKQNQIEQVLASPRTPREKLQLRMEEGARLREEEARHTAEREHKQRLLAEAQQQRHLYHASLIDHASSQYLQQTASLPSPRDRAAATFEDSPSFVSKMLAENLHREATHKAHKKDLAASNRSGADSTTPISPRQRDPMADLKSPAYRQRLDHQIQMLEKFDAEAAEQKREQVAHVKYIQKLQAEEKKTQVAREAEELVREAEYRKKAKDDDDAMFRQFVEQQLPQGMSPRVQQSATKAPYAHLH